MVDLGISKHSEIIKWPKTFIVFAKKVHFLSLTVISVSSGRDKICSTRAMWFSSALENVKISTKWTKALLHTTADSTTSIAC